MFTLIHKYRQWPSDAGGNYFIVEVDTIWTNSNLSDQPKRKATASPEKSHIVKFNNVDQFRGKNSLANETRYIPVPNLVVNIHVLVATFETILLCLKKSRERKFIRLNFCLRSISEISW